ncbi:O-antigen ligase family protein [Flavobacteriaceae bacterium]|nr:O-antigen ligase family protein [Flavobacteriaceae bacterium]
MIKILPKVFLFSYLLIGLIPEINALDRMNYQFVFLSSISIFHCIYNLFVYKVSKIKLGVIPLLFLFLIFISFLSISISLNLPESLIDLSKLLTLVLVLINVIVTIQNDSKIQSFIFACITLSLLVEVSSIFLTFIDNYNLSVVDKAGRSFIYRGITGNLNIAGFSIAMKLPFLLYYCLRANSYLRKIAISLLITLSIFCISLTGSRGALLSIYISIILFSSYFAYKSYTTKSYAKFFNSLFIIIPFITVFIINELIFNTLKISYRTVEIFQRGSSSRIAYWKDAFESIIENPFLGVGIGQWKIFAVKYGAENMWDYTFIYHAHNDFIQMIAELGVFGIIYLVIPVVIIISIFKRIINRTNLEFEIILLISITVFCIDSSLNFPVFRPVVSATYFVLLAILSSHIKLNTTNLKFINSYRVLLILCLAGLYPQYKLLISGIEQRNLLGDYNAKIFDDPIELIESYNDKFPSILQTGLPIKAMKGIYFFYAKDTTRAIEILKKPNLNDNPFVGAYEASLAQIYDAKGELDSAYKYSAIAYEKLPNNLYHAGYYIRTLQKMKKYNDVVDVYKNYKQKDEAIDYYFIMSVYDPEFEYDMDSLRFDLLNVRKKYPNNTFFKLAFQENYYGGDVLDKSVEYTILADEYFKNKQYDLAYQNYKNARDLVPTEYSHSQNMALSKFNLDKYQEAIDIIDYTLDSLIVPDDAGRIYAIRGGSKLVLDKKRAACSDFFKGVQKKDELSTRLLLQNCQSFIENVQFIEN